MYLALEHLKARLASFHREERGAAMVEYGILVGFIAVVVMASVILLGSQISSLFTDITSKL